MMMTLAEFLYPFQLYKDKINVILRETTLSSDEKVAEIGIYLKSGSKCFFRLYITYGKDDVLSLDIIEDFLNHGEDIMCNANVVSVDVNVDGAGSCYSTWFYESAYEFISSVKLMNKRIIMNAKKKRNASWLSDRVFVSKLEYLTAETWKEFINVFFNEKLYMPVVEHVKEQFKEAFPVTRIYSLAKDICELEKEKRKITESIFITIEKPQSYHTGNKQLTIRIYNEVDHTITSFVISPRKLVKITSTDRTQYFDFIDVRDHDPAYKYLLYSLVIAQFKEVKLEEKLEVLWRVLQLESKLSKKNDSKNVLTV